MTTGTLTTSNKRPTTPVYRNAYRIARYNDENNAPRQADHYNIIGDGSKMIKKLEKDTDGDVGGNAWPTDAREQYPCRNHTS